MLGIKCTINKEHILLRRKLKRKSNSSSKKTLTKSQLNKQLLSNLNRWIHRLKRSINLMINKSSCSLRHNWEQVQRQPARNKEVESLLKVCACSNNNKRVNCHLEKSKSRITNKLAIKTSKAWSKTLQRVVSSSLQVQLNPQQNVALEVVS